ncbi:MAG: S9 family peptidase, partial [bacterium]|nr:S9 family peptidase [bacterium]
SKPARQVTHFHQKWDATAFIQPQELRYKSFDGTEIEAFLFKPGNSKPGTPLPLVVLVHGGPDGRFTHRFLTWSQFMASRGLAVLCPNIRGSTGYGYNFMSKNRYDWGGGDFKDVMAGVDFLIKKGIAHPERLGICGWSYGGYMSAWAVTQTHRFKAAVSGAPMTDLAFEYGAEISSINAYDTWYLGTPYENLDDFIKMSPITYVKNVRTPTLILCGENDLIDPVEQCKQFYRGLKRYKR